MTFSTSTFKAVKLSVRYILYTWSLISLWCVSVRSPQESITSITATKPSQWEGTKNQITWVEGRGKETGSARSWCVGNPQVGQGDDRPTTSPLLSSFVPTYLTPVRPTSCVCCFIQVYRMISKTGFDCQKNSKCIIVPYGMLRSWGHVCAIDLNWWLLSKHVCGSCFRSLHIWNAKINGTISFSMNTCVYQRKSFIYRLLITLPVTVFFSILVQC